MFAQAEEEEEEEEEEVEAEDTTPPPETVQAEPVVSITHVHHMLLMR